MQYTEVQNFGRENFDDSTCIRQISSDFSIVKVLRYTVSGQTMLNLVGQIYCTFSIGLPSPINGQLTSSTILSSA